jgi:hypothetical protein
MIALWVGFLYDFATFIKMFSLGTGFNILLKYFIMLLLIKILPLYILRRTPIQWARDTVALITIFAAYNIYLYVNNTNSVEIYEKTERNILSGENRTPLFRLMESMILFFTGKP